MYLKCDIFSVYIVGNFSVLPTHLYDRTTSHPFITSLISDFAYLLLKRFSKSSFNGLLDYAGDIGPFQLAIALTVLSMFIIFFWRENYGHCDPEEGKKKDACVGFVTS